MLGFIDDVFKINRSTTTANSDCNFKPKPKDSRVGSGGALAVVETKLKNAPTIFEYKDIWKLTQLGFHTFWRNAV